MKSNQDTSSAAYTSRQEPSPGPAELLYVASADTLVPNHGAHLLRTAREMAFIDGQQRTAFAYLVDAHAKHLHDLLACYADAPPTRDRTLESACKAYLAAVYALTCNSGRADVVKPAKKNFIVETQRSSSPVAELRATDTRDALAGFLFWEGAARRTAPRTASARSPTNGLMPSRRNPGPGAWARMPISRWRNRPA
jgi:hypothetical protein